MLFSGKFLKSTILRAALGNQSTRFRSMCVSVVQQSDTPVKIDALGNICVVHHTFVEMHPWMFSSVYSVENRIRFSGGKWSVCPLAIKHKEPIATKTQPTYCSNV